MFDRRSSCEVSVNVKQGGNHYTSDLSPVHGYLRFFCFDSHSPLKSVERRRRYLVWFGPNTEGGWISVFVILRPEVAMGKGFRAVHGCRFGLSEGLLEVAKCAMYRCSRVLLRFFKQFATRACRRVNLTIMF